MVQDSNVHDLIADFESEIPCYTQISDLISLFEGLEISGYPIADIETIYQRLEAADIVEPDELVYLDQWLSAI